MKIANSALIVALLIVLVFVGIIMLAPALKQASPQPIIAQPATIQTSPKTQTPIPAKVYVGPGEIRVQF